MVKMMMATTNTHVTPFNMEKYMYICADAEHREEGDKSASQIERPYVKTEKPLDIAHIQMNIYYIRNMRINKWMGHNIFAMENKHKFIFCEI